MIARIRVHRWKLIVSEERHGTETEDSDRVPTFNCPHDSIEERIEPISRRHLTNVGRSGISGDSNGRRTTGRTEEENTDRDKRRGSRKPRHNPGHSIYRRPIIRPPGGLAPAHKHTTVGTEGGSHRNHGSTLWTER